MPILKFVNDDYSESGSLERIIYYAIRPDKTPFNYIGSMGIVISDAAYEMLLVKKAFDKTGGRQARHFIVSFASEECVTAYDALVLGYDIARYYSSRYQIIFGVHQDEPQIHIHFVFNTVSFIDGLMYAEGKDDYFRLKNYIDEQMRKYR
jgi:hypothetical protein